MARSPTASSGSLSSSHARRSRERAAGDGLTSHDMHEALSRSSHAHEAHEPQQARHAREPHAREGAQGSERPTLLDGAGMLAMMRNPMGWGLQNSVACLQATEELQRAQIDGVHQMLLRQEEACERLQSCKDAPELAALQAELMRFGSANLIQMSQRTMDAMMHLNTALVRSWATLVDGNRSNFTRSAFEMFQNSMHTGIKPLDDLFNAPLLRELMQPLRGQAEGASKAP